jgi:hypothetical protein
MSGLTNGSGRALGLALTAALLLAPLGPARSEEDEPAPDQPAKKTQPASLVTRGAIAPGEALLLLKGKPLERSDVECIAEDLTLVVRPTEVLVKAEYVLRSQPPAAKRLELAVPFALGQQEILLNEKKVELVTLGHPEGYGIWVDDEEYRFSELRAGPVPEGVELPPIEGGRLPPDFYLPEREDGSTLPIRFKSTYRWNHFVTPITFPDDKPVSVRVEFTAPYLSYVRETSRGDVSSPGSFRYLLSTGGNWRGGTVGRFHVSVKAEGIPLSQVDLSGLDFVPNDTGATFDATDFHAGPAGDLQVRLSEFERLRVECSEVPPAVPFTILDRPQEVSRPWVAAAIRPDAPLEIHLDRKPGRDRKPDPGTKADAAERRYRIGFSIVSHERQYPRLKRVRVALSFGRARSRSTPPPPRQFSASFADASDESIQANRGWHYLIFRSAEAPSAVRLSITDVYPGDRDDRRLRIDGLVLEQERSSGPGDDDVAAPAE